MVQTSPTPFDVGRAFVHQYYTLLHQAPHLLHRFYSTDSTFIHGGVDRPGCVEQPAVGPENISQRIQDLNLRDCHAKIRQVDSHPTIGDGVVVQVTGELSNNGDPMRRFMQTFVLAPRQPKKYYVQNDIFRYQDEVFDDGSDEVDEDDRSGSHIYGDTISNVDKVSNADSSNVAMATQQALLVTATARGQSLGEQQPLPPRSNGQSMANAHPQVIANQQEHAHVDSNTMNGFANAGVTDSSAYVGLSHSHLPATQETGTSHVQPSPQSANHQETTSQTNGSSHANNVVQQQQTSKVTSSTQPPATEGHRPEGIASYAGIAKLNSATSSALNANNAGVSSNAAAPRTVAPNNSNAPGTVSSSTTGPTAPNNVRPPMKPGTGRPSNNPAGGPPHSNQGRGGGGNNYYQQNNRGLTVSTAPNENQVFVGSLPAEFTAQTLIECFSKFGRVYDAKIYVTNNDSKRNYGFVVFDNPEIASRVVAMEHIAYNDTIRLNVEAKTPRNAPPSGNPGGNYNNGIQGSGRYSGYQPRGGGRGGNRGSYRGGAPGSGNNPRRGGGQFNNNSFTFGAGDEHNADYRPSKLHAQQQQGQAQPQQ